MENNQEIHNDKVRIGFYIEKKILNQIESLMKESNARSRNEFVNQALKFYIGYQTSKKTEDYMLKTMSAILVSSVQASENRIARAAFKVAIELSKLSHVISYTQNIDADAMNKLQAKCVEEVKRINGAVKFEDAYNFQNRK